jgi:uncharacterized protein (DUF1697 family)
MRYVVLLRGINVGGRNKVRMAALTDVLSDRYTGVRAYLQTGNVVLDSEESAPDIAAWTEQALPAAFSLDSDLVRALVLDRDAFERVVAEAPPGFGADNDTYRYDVAYFIGATAADIEPYVPVNPEVDVVSWGSLAFYHRRIAALASRSRVSRVIGTPAYASLTLRNWRTTARLADMLREPSS